MQLPAKTRDNRPFQSFPAVIIVAYILAILPANLHDACRMNIGMNITISGEMKSVWLSGWRWMKLEEILQPFNQSDKTKYFASFNTFWIKQNRKTRRLNWARYQPQLSSSLLSPQSSNPSQEWESGMQSPDPKQRNKFIPQSGRNLNKILMWNMKILCPG